MGALVVQVVMVLLALNLLSALWMVWRNRDGQALTQALLYGGLLVVLSMKSAVLAHHINHLLESSSGRPFKDINWQQAWQEVQVFWKILLRGHL